MSYDITVRRKNKMKTGKTLASIVLAGTLALAGCKDEENSGRTDYSSRQQETFVTTAERVVIEPHYGSDKILMDGIVMKRFAYGNGLHVPDTEDSVVYKKGSTEYEALRPLLTVEQSK